MRRIKLFAFLCKHALLYGWYRAKADAETNLDLRIKYILLAEVHGSLADSAAKGLQ